MNAHVDTDLCVIGAGSGGLSVAAGASQMGARVVLIEKGKMGGDCLNYGCVPSKSLLAAARAAETMRQGGRFGVNGHEPEIDFLRVNRHVHGVIASIAPHDSVERFEGLGVHVIQAPARFVDGRTVQAGDVTVRARRFIVATGSRPSVPPIPGLADVRYLTNETIFDLTERPEHLIVIGGGPIGSEMAQAHRRLGSRVTLLQRSEILPKDDREVVEVLRRRLREDGIDLHERVQIQEATASGNRIAVDIAANGVAERIEGSHLLVAIGREPSVNGLDLEAAGIEFGRKGIVVDDRLRTTNRRVYAIGDVIGSYQFTHMASYHAGIVIRNALFRLPAKVDDKAVPWVTYTDPEVAHVGLLEDEARARHGESVQTVTWPFAENDRAQAERDTEGLIKVVVGRRGRVLGASIVGHHAGDHLMPWVLAISEGLKIGALAKIIAPYPTRGEVSKRVAGSYFTPSLFGERTRKVVRFMQRFG